MLKPGGMEVEDEGKEEVIVEMLTDNSIHEKSAVNQVTSHKSKQTIYENLAENQCVIPMSPLPCKYRSWR